MQFVKLGHFLTGYYQNVLFPISRTALSIFRLSHEMNHDSRKNVETIHNKTQPNKWRQAETRRNGIHYIVTFAKGESAKNKKNIKDMNHNLNPFRLNISCCWFFYAWNYEHVCVLTSRLFKAKIINAGLQLKEPRHDWNIAWITNCLDIEYCKHLNNALTTSTHSHY